MWVISVQNLKVSSPGNTKIAGKKRSLQWLTKITFGLLRWRYFKTGWWFQIFVIFTPNLGEDEPNLTFIVFNWVGEKPPTRKVEEGWICFWYSQSLPVAGSANHTGTPFIAKSEASSTPMQIYSKARCLPGKGRLGGYDHLNYSVLWGKY